MSTWIQKRVTEPSTWAGAGTVCIGVGVLIGLNWFSIAGIALGAFSIIMQDRA
jgi:hypothetical protein